MGTISITSNGGGATAAVGVSDGVSAISTVETSRSVAFVFSISGGADAALFSIDSSSGVLTLVSPAEPGAYSVIVRATDPDNSAFVEQEITVSVQASAAGGTQFFGTGIGSALNTNNRVADWSAPASNNVTMACSGFIAQGTRIDAIRQYLVQRTFFPNGYSAGNGGTIRTEIRSHDAVNGRPSDTVLAQTYEYPGDTKQLTTSAAAEAAYPGVSYPSGSGTAKENFPQHDLTSPLTVTPGDKLWLCTYQVRGGEANHVSVNCNRNRHQFIRAQIDPDFDADVERRVWVKYGDTWFDDSAHAVFGATGIFEIIGDVNHGHSLFSVPSSGLIGGDPDRCRDVSATLRVRQSLIFDADTTLDELSIFAGRSAGSSDLVCDIKQGGSTLHTVSLSGFPLLSAHDEVHDIHNACGWVTASLGGVAVSATTPVYFELRTSSGTAYEIPHVLNYQGIYFLSGGLTGCNMAFSNDSGANWTDAANVHIGIALLGHAT